MTDRVGIRGLGVIVKLWDTGKQIIEVGMNFSYSFVRALYILKILCVHVCVCIANVCPGFLFLNLVPSVLTYKLSILVQ